MNTLPLARLLGAGPSGVFVVTGDPPPSRIAALSRLRGLRPFEVDCGSVRTKRRLMEQLARSLAFPDYFGANWDALADCLTDLEWVPADGYVLTLRGLQGLARQSPRDYAMLLGVLTDAAQYWQQEEVAFYVLLAGEATELGSDLPVISG